jgi:flagellar motor switch protein FliN/FliY
VIDVPVNLDLLLEVDLDVTAELGSARMSVADVLALGPGAVVEFGKSVEQALDLKVNGRTIARGEIVAVDGRFGLRITELVGSGSANGAP